MPTIYVLYCSLFLILWTTVQIETNDVVYIIFRDSKWMRKIELDIDNFVHRYSFADDIQINFAESIEYFANLKWISNLWHLAGRKICNQKNIRSFCMYENWFSGKIVFLSFYSIAVDWLVQLEKYSNDWPILK